VRCRDRCERCVLGLAHTRAQRWLVGLGRQVRNSAYSARSKHVTSSLICRAHQLELTIHRQWISLPDCYTVCPAFMSVGSEPVLGTGVTHAVANRSAESALYAPCVELPRRSGTRGALARCAKAKRTSPAEQATMYNVGASASEARETDDFAGCHRLVECE